MTPTRNRFSRAAVIAACAGLLASGAAVVQAESASAAGCRAGVVCGAVKNRTGRTMSISTHLGSGGGFCDVWNRDGGTGESFWHAPCDQIGIGNGTRGGLGSGEDVDAFSFNGEGYHERFTRIGTWHWRKKGVWTKVESHQIADCGIGDGNEIWCTVLIQ